MLPEIFTLSARVSGGGDDVTDIEMRTPTEKYTVASEVNDRFAPLFLAAGDLLAVCEDWQRYFDKLMEHDEPGDPLAEIRNSFHKERVDRTRAAVSKARGQ